MIKKNLAVLAAVATLGVAAIPNTAFAGSDSGFYLGAGMGTGTLNADVPTGGTTNPEFSGNATAYKAFAGYNFGLVPFLDLAVEGGYVNLGEPGDVVDLLPISATIDGMSAFGVVGFNLGPVGLFAKAGMINWDAELSIDGLSESDSGSDPAYGVGAKMQFGSVAVRLEAEQFDIKDINDLYMVSLSLVWTF